MATGRTLLHHARVYVDGYDLSGQVRTLAPIQWGYAAESDAALTDAVKTAYPGIADIRLDQINSFLATNVGATELHDTFKNGSGTLRTVMVAIGIRAAPAAGDPAFGWKFYQSRYQVEQDRTWMVSNLGLAPIGPEVGILFSKPIGLLLHAKSAETAVNSAIGLDELAASSYGGFMVYHLFSSNGTVTLKIQHASTNTNPSFSDLTGLTSGSIDATTTPVSNLVQGATNLSVNRYVRWQLVFGTATTATFALSWHRAALHNI